MSKFSFLVRRDQLIAAFVAAGCVAEQQAQCLIGASWNQNVLSVQLRVLAWDAEIAVERWVPWQVPGQPAGGFDDPTDKRVNEATLLLRPKVPEWLQKLKQLNGTHVDVWGTVVADRATITLSDLAADRIEGDTITTRLATRFTLRDVELAASWPTVAALGDEPRPTGLTGMATLSQAQLLQTVATVGWCVGDRAANLATSCVHVQLRGRLEKPARKRAKDSVETVPAQLHVAATNGAALVTSSVVCEGVVVDNASAHVSGPVVATVLVPKRAIKALTKAFANVAGRPEIGAAGTVTFNPAEIQLTIRDGTLRLATHDARFVCVEPKGRFPDWRPIVQEQEPVWGLECELADLAQVCETCAVVNDSKVTLSCYLHESPLTDGELTPLVEVECHAIGEADEARAILASCAKSQKPVTIDGTPIGSVVINPEFLRQFATSLPKSRRCLLLVGSSEQPVVLVDLPTESNGLPKNYAQAIAPVGRTVAVIMPFAVKTACATASATKNN